MERLDFMTAEYSAVEATIHMGRYLNVKPFVEGKRVLDVACGEGYGSNLIRQWGATEVVGVDVSSEAIDAAKSLFERDGITFFCGNGEELSFSDESFDVVVSLETIEHLDCPEKFLSEIKRVIKKDGIMVISCPNDHYYAQNIRDFDNPFHKRRYNFHEFREIVENSLGEASCWLMGNGISGFVNCPLEKCKHPEDENAIPENMLGMMKAQRLSTVLEVPASEYVNHWSSVYYVGIWTKEAVQDDMESAVVFPYPYFWRSTQYPEAGKMIRSLAENNDALIKNEAKLKEMLCALETEKETLAKNEAELKEMQRVLKVENERQSIMLSLLKKEEGIFGENYSTLNAAHEQMKAAYQQLNVAHEQMKAAYQQLNAAHEQLKAEHHAMTQTKGWRLLEKARRFVNRLKRK